MKSKYILTVVIALLCWHSVNSFAESAEDNYASGVASFKNSDYSSAIHYFDKSAKQGSRLAQGMLCSIYNYGTGVQQNYQTAAYWCEKSALQGDPMAQYDLGNMYIKGEGVNNDFKKAIYWLLNSAKSGHPPAYFNLGVLYYKGQGSTQNFVESYKWFSLAERNGIPNSGKWTHTLEHKMSSNQILEAKKLANEWVSQPKR